MMLLHFPEKMIPKVHYTREYAQIIRDYGPSTRTWCLRYEACHAYFKKLAIRTNNFKNTSKMLATHFRLKQCLKFTRLSQLGNTDYASGMKKINTSSFNSSMKNVLLNHFGSIDLDNDLLQCNRLTYANIEYCRSSVYVVNLRTDNEQPLFAQIIFILKLQEKWWLMVDLLDTISFDENLFAWEVKSIDIYTFLDPSQLAFLYKGLDIYHVKDSSFISFTSRLTLH